jgi:hypothetical protein
LRETDFDSQRRKLRAAAAMELSIRPEDAVSMYTDVTAWNSIFPETIHAASIVGFGQGWKAVEVIHKSAGTVLNLLVDVAPPYCVGIYEEKPLYEAWFLNEFLPSGTGTLYRLTGWVALRGVLRPLTPVLARYVRRIMLIQMNQLVLDPFSRAATQF